MANRGAAHATAQQETDKQLRALIESLRGGNRSREIEIPTKC